MKKAHKEIGYGDDTKADQLMGSPRKPSEAVFVGRGGAAQRVSFAACGEARDAELAMTRVEGKRFYTY